MSDDAASLTNDRRLTAEHIGQLTDAARVVAFFAHLGYDADRAIPLDHASLGLDSADLRQQIRRIQRVAESPAGDPAESRIVVYLFEARSVTVSLVQAIARRFRERTEDALLVLTRDYEALDFVLLERELAAGRSKLGGGLRQLIRPRSVTVRRRNPSAVALRVLRRFTVTEEDADYQWDKLRSAFTLAEWSEQYFNNRALFSDYYLLERLTDPQLTPAWGEDVRPIGREVMRHLAAARASYSGKPEQVIRDGLYEPLFRSLGFEFAVHKPGDSDLDEPDYVLFAAGDRTKPLAQVMTYVWNRNLDDTDDKRDPQTPDEIPGALVVNVLAKAETNWVVVTNGKLWRLYSATAANKATNYYEIDLEEAANAPDQITALRYWWLFFRRQAFTGFLDDLLQQSADYARGLGERLKERTFTTIFPHFARGFIEHARTGSPRRTASPDGPDAVFQATLTFLYRLMFVLYAESLSLLPVSEERGYGELSLQRLRRELAEAGGPIEDEAPQRLAQRYSASSTELYGNLQRLFRAIDAGDAGLNLPTYNGGLFSAHTPEGRFLAEHAIPDRFLALGLDRLCRDVDEKTQALAMIDYKSLGVRQLGSIYEGLLEFKLRVAAEPLVVVKEKGKEVYLPARQAGGKKALATLAPGDVYLENDKRERKATGSYYTPDYIVKYIVEHTVGPVLDAKLAALEPRLRAAQKLYRERRANALAKGEDPEKFWNNPEMKRLADDCLDVRVLDPAMGSGHFLVEAVDFVGNRLIQFLNAWSDNPVWALLARTRQDILDDMERQGVSIDEARLTRVSLLKRSVLKRCIYGVDLNPMAVELAKVSLWLDAFTLGAPLSFLDHHLKCGNSLIGGRVREAQALLAPREGETYSLLAGNQWAGVMLATDLMRQVSYLSDNTAGQLAESRAAYRAAGDHLAPFKRILDVVVSRWFGNGPAKSGFEPALELLRRPEAEGWLRNPDPAVWPEKDYMNARQVAATALRAAEEKRFFHWELEFPEVFFAPATPGGQDVQLREDGGFDAVVGNPPYDELSEDALGRVIDEREFLTAADVFAPASGSGGRLNWYHFFMVIGMDLLSPGGRNGVIVPMAWLGDSFTFGVRKWLLENHSPTLIEAFPQKDNPYDRVFFDAKLPTSVYVAQKSTQRSSFRVRVHPGKSILSHQHYQADVETITTLSPEALLIPLVNQLEWTLLHKLAHSDALGPLSNYGAEPTSGEIIFNSATRPFMTSDSRYDLILRGSHIQRYELAETAKQGQPEYLKREEYLKNAGKDSKAYAHLKPRIVYQEGSAIDAWRRVVPTFLPAGHVCGHKVCYFTNYKIDMLALLAIFGSNWINWLVERLSVTNSLPAYLIGNLPFPRFAFKTPSDRRAQLATKGRALYERSLAEGRTCVLEFVAHHLALDESDVVHDLLAFLAEQMIELNKQKQAEVKRFLGWLEGMLRIKVPGTADSARHLGGIDSLTGKTILQGYLGDYQKGERELPWADFYYRLHQNRNRFAVSLESVKGEIEAEYERSLAVLLPIKRQLAHTDGLIDQIVYQLYGLTDAEIAVVEGPAYQQALGDAKAEVLRDKTLAADPEAAVEAMAEKVLPASQRLQSQVSLAAERARLDADLPGWQLFPDEVATFLLTGEYNIATQPDFLDFSTSVVSYAKAVEAMLYHRLFGRFRAESGASAADCRNKFLQDFVADGKPLTLGSMPIILASSKEPALRAFVQQIYPRAAQTFYGPGGVVERLQDPAAVALRNQAAHDQALPRSDAQAARAWALGILQYL